ncbi:DinB family protein [bacterium]|nr:DinB family protein [bacterium]
MSIADAYIQELEKEAVSTRKALEAVPGDKLMWKPHEKSFTLGQLAYHIASSNGFFAEHLLNDEFEVPNFEMRQPDSKEELLKLHEESVEKAKQTLSQLDDEKMFTQWKILANGAELMSVPRVAVGRYFMLNHWYHHRGQLTVYLRLLDAPVPSIYGPSADENPFAGV